MDLDGCEALLCRGLCDERIRIDDTVGVRVTGVLPEVLYIYVLVYAVSYVKQAALDIYV